MNIILFQIAQVVSKPSGIPGPLNDTKISDIMSWAFAILGGISLVIITLQGMRYALSGGDPGKTKQAKDGIIYALVGIIVAISGAALTQFVLKQVLNDVSTDDSFLKGDTSIFASIAALLVFITAAISVIMIVISGIKYNLSGGDAQKTASAKNGIIYALIGLVVSVIAGPLIVFVLNQIN